MIPQVENPHPRAAWFADERIVAAPPFGQFKSEEVRDVGPIITDQDSWPAILGYGFPRQSRGSSKHVSRKSRGS